jgi:hypothetical protein
MKIRVGKAELLEGDGQTGRQVDMTKLTVIFRNSANVPKNKQIIFIYVFIYVFIYLCIYLFMYIFIYVLFIYAFIYYCIYVFIYLYIYLCIYLFMKQEFTMMENCSSFAVYFFYCQMLCYCLCY